VVSSDEEIIHCVKSRRQYGWESKYIVADAGGRNSRLDEIQAAVLSVKLKQLDQWNQQRRTIMQYYNENIVHAEIRCPAFTNEDKGHVGHLYVLRTRYRDALRSYLRQHGIATEIHYPVLDYQQPLLKKNFSTTDLPVSELVIKEIVTLPCYPELPLDAVEQACKIINQWKP
jgi:dTDP-4-amino-4,6-dideoxygalactose transaminase